MSKETINHKINELKEEKEYYINQIMLVENIGYNFQEPNENNVSYELSDSSEIDDIMDIEQKCREIKKLINKLYSNKIKDLTLSLKKD